MDKSHVQEAKKTTVQTIWNVTQDGQGSYFCRATMIQYLVCLDLDLESEVKYQRQIKDNLISKHSCAYRVQMILYLVYPVQGLESEVMQQIKSNLIWKLSCAYRVLMIPYLVYPGQGLESGVKYQWQIKDNQILKLLCAYRVQMILYLVYPVQGLESEVIQQIKSNL